MPKPIKDEIWILADNRPGNYSQALGLANELGFELRIINIAYGIFSFLPNFILRSSLLAITRDTKIKLESFGYFPKLIISAGRRSASVALHIKKQSKNISKIAQIMNPDFAQDEFDFIILPRHDKISDRYKNIIRTLGSLTKTNELAIKAECEKFDSWFRDYQKTKIALLIGGDSKSTKFTAESVIKLIKKSCDIAKNMNAKLLILNSRRTSDEVTNAIKSTLYGDFKFFDWKEITNGENPYLAIVGFSDFFIVTGDSVSMISEVCSTGKPLYIFDEKNISSMKHKKFHQELISQNYAKRIDKTTRLLENFSAKKLQETKRVAMIIRNALKK